MTELDRAVEEVRVAWSALQKARVRFNRCTREDSRRAAQVAMNEAESSYRVASDRRDQLVELDRAARTQRGDDRGAAWSIAANGGRAPVVERIAEVVTITLTRRQAELVATSMEAFDDSTSRAWREASAIATKIRRSLGGRR